jgi:hypothetical protein
MPRDEGLIPTTLLSVASFRRDLLRLLGLSAHALEWLNSIGDGPDGFYAPVQSAKLAEHAGVGLEDAMGAVRVAEYVYERCRESHIAPDDGVTELLQIAATFQVEDAADKASALRALLSTKSGYEAGRYARKRTLSTVHHFEGLDGVWDNRPIFDRDTGEVLKSVPVLIMGVSWHDKTGTSHDAVFQLDDDDWRDFVERVEQLKRQREALQRHLGG